MKRRTDGQLRAMRELCALARVGLDVADVIAARGEESDDRPRAWLLSLERWCRGEETGPQLAARTRAMEVWRDAVFAKPRGPKEPVDVDPWGLALHWLSDARVDLVRNPGHRGHHVLVVDAAARTLRRVDGETIDASVARVAAMLDRHRKAVGEECARAEVAARLTQAKADKITAERALGTFPGMMTEGGR